MKTPDHTTEQAEGHVVVKVGRAVAGRLTEERERPGLWVVEDESGRFMGRVATQEQGAAFLAAWFVAEDEDWA